MEHYFPNSSSSSSNNTTNISKYRNKKVSSSPTLNLSTDPQSIAARERRHRISDRFKILRSMVPGGTKMDTVSMLDEAIHYVKFLKAQVLFHQNMLLNTTTATNPSYAAELNDDFGLFGTYNLVDDDHTQQLGIIHDDPCFFLQCQEALAYHDGDTWNKYYN